MDKVFEEELAELLKKLSDAQKRSVLNYIKSLLDNQYNTSLDQTVAEPIEAIYPENEFKYDAETLSMLNSLVANKNTGRSYSREEVFKFVRQNKLN